MQHSATDLMITPVPELIADISTILPLLPGNLIASGTIGGVGGKRNPQLPLNPGDVMEVEIGSICILRDTAEAEA